MRRFARCVEKRFGNIPAEPIDCRGGKVGERSAYPFRLQSETIQQSARNRATWTIGELVEGTVRSHLAERTAQDREHLARRHRQERQSADDSASQPSVKEIDRPQSGGVHAERSRLRIVALEHGGKLGPELDQREVLLNGAAGDKGARKRAGARPQLDDRPGVA
ncbi:hypothetical protein [Bordetella sp. 2513F-2]